MATSAPEHTTHSKEAETNSLGNRSVYHAPQPVIEPEGEVAARMFGGTSLQPSLHGVAKLFSSAAISHSANSSIRFATIQRAQRTHGNHFARRVIDGIQRKAAMQNHASGLSLSSSADEAVIPANSAGQPLDERTRDFMESSFRRDFSDIEVHTDAKAEASAKALDADAYTSGRDIYFAKGQYAPESEEGTRLLAHELTHTIQQSEGKVPVGMAMRLDGVVVGGADDPTEMEAERTADEVTTGGRLSANNKASNGSPGSLVGRHLIQRRLRIVQRDKDSSAPKGLNADEYVKRHAEMITFAVSTRMARIELATGSPFASWPSGQARPFMTTLWEDLSRDKLLETLRSLLQPIPIETIVDRGRDLSVEVTDTGEQFQTGRGKDAYSTDVATELTNALTAQLNQSLRRIMPRYVTQRYKLKLGLPAKADKTVVPQPSPADILPAHPMDHLVIATLCKGGMVDVDFERFSKERPAVDEPNKASKPRAVTFEFQGAKGAWFWLLAKDPPDATVEEVASSLYGDPTQAFRMVDAAPLFGFTGADLLLPANKDKLKEMSADPKAAESTLYPLAKQQAGLGFEPVNLDPLAELMKGPLADDAALNQASRLKAPTASNKPKVLEDMRLSFEILDGMIPNARRFHDDGRLAEARGHLEAKRNALLKADDLEAVRWAAQAAEQRRILGGASTGLGMAVTQLDALLKADKRIMHGHELADYVKMPLLELATAYVTAAAQSFFVGSGAAALAAADDRSRLYNVELMEGILRSVAHSIEVAEKDKTGEKEGGNEFEFGISKLREREEAIRTRLSNARQAILRNPDEIGTILEEIYKEVADLQTEVAIVANLDAIDSLVKALYDSQDWWGDILNHEYELRRNHLEEVAYWRRAWERVYDSWKKGDRDKAKDGFHDLVTNPDFTSLFERTADYVKDAATWALVARIVGLIAITALTWGIGSWATGFSAARWGGALAAGGELAAGAARAGMIGGAVAEAVTFTTLNALLLEPDVTLKGFLADFGANLLLFGILRKFSMMYRAAAAVKAAAAAGKTTLVAAGEMGIAWATTTIANIARAEIEERLKHQKDLTKEEIGKILLKSTAMFIGMVVASRVAEPLMKELAASGTTTGVRLRLINAQRARMAVIAENTRANGDIAQARALIVEDRAELQTEIDFYEQVLKNPDVLAAAGYKPEQIKSLREIGEAQILEINIAEAMIEAEQIGDNVYEMPQEKLPAALEAYRKAGAEEPQLLRRDETAKSETWLIKWKGQEVRITTKAPDQTKIRLDTLRNSLSAEGQEAFDRFVARAITPKDALEQLDKMSKSRRGLEASVIEAAKRLPVLETVPGLYAGVRIDPQQGPWTFDTHREETTFPDGTRQITITTNVTLKTPDGTIHSAGPVMRTITLRPNAGGGYDVDLTMDMAFLNAIPENLRWVNEGGVPLREGSGIPLQTYITLMQMKMEGVGLGQLTTAHMSTIVNARAICELASLRQKYAPGIPANRIPTNLIERTQAGKYGMTNVIQAGAKVRGMRIEGGSEATVDSIVRGSEMDEDAKLAELGLSRNQKILKGFEIVIDIDPPAAPSPGTKGKP
jgi:hypothetical protein